MEAAELAPHYIWNMPSGLTGKGTWQTRDKLTAEQALRSNPDAWPVYRSLEMLPVKRVATVCPRDARRCLAVQAA